MARARQNAGMNQHIDLDTVTLSKDGDTLTVTHHKTGLVQEISMAALVRWIIRQLRATL